MTDIYNLWVRIYLTRPGCHPIYSFQSLMSTYRNLPTFLIIWHSGYLFVWLFSDITRKNFFTFVIKSVSLRRTEWQWRIITCPLLISYQHWTGIQDDWVTILPTSGSKLRIWAESTPRSPTLPEDTFSCKSFNRSSLLLKGAAAKFSVILHTTLPSL